MQKNITINHAHNPDDTQKQMFSHKLNYTQLSIFLIFHLITLGLLSRVSWAPQWLLLALFMHHVRFFGVSVVLHRYFSHKAFRTSRGFQAILALIGSLTLIRGPIRFASAHRYHHVHSDTERDLHSPKHGFWWSYVGWLMSKEFVQVSQARAKDLRKYPELVALDRFYYLPSVILALAFYQVWGLNGLVWGSLFSTLTSWHLAFFVTSVFHVVGKQDFNTGDQSRNHFWLALITMGEGWHNNHHHDMISAQMGYKPSQPDPGYWLICIMEKLHLIEQVKRFNITQPLNPQTINIQSKRKP